MISRTKAEAAATRMGVDLEGLTMEQVRAAYRREAKASHPDSPYGSAERFQSLTVALEALTAWLAAPPLRPISGPVRQPGKVGTCRACGGQGFTQRRYGFQFGPRVMCVMCSGTGNPKKETNQ